MKARAVMIVLTSAPLQAARILANPAEKFIIAGTRLADISPKTVTATPFEFGSITPTAFPGSAVKASLAPKIRAPMSNRL